jgi:hypothetical protein
MGGPGKHGTDGISVPTISSCHGFQCPYPNNTVYIELYKHINGWIKSSTEYYTEGSMVMPTSGTNGEDSAEPGTGGKGGTLLVPDFELIKDISIDVSGGVSGDLGTPPETSIVING